MRCLCVHKTEDFIGTTTGMVTACLIATTATWTKSSDDIPGAEENEGVDLYDSMDGPSEEEAYLQGGFAKLHISWAQTEYQRHNAAGEYKTILQLVGVLSNGKLAKRLTDQAIDLMQDVQNLRRAIYEYVHAISLKVIRTLIPRRPSAINSKSTHARKAARNKRNCCIWASTICKCCKGFFAKLFR
jgi:hypothetical protein